MNEQMIRDLLQKLEAYGIKGWEVLVRGYWRTSCVEASIGLVIIVTSLMVSYKFYKLTKEDDDWTPGIFIPLAFTVLGLLTFGSGILGMVAPDYYILKKCLFKD